jgi:hypothetical protein
MASETIGKKFGEEIFTEANSVTNGVILLAW